MQRRTGGGSSQSGRWSMPPEILSAWLTYARRKGKGATHCCNSEPQLLFRCVWKGYKSLAGGDCGGSHGYSFLVRRFGESVVGNSRSSCESWGLGCGALVLEDSLFVTAGDLAPSGPVSFRVLSTRRESELWGLHGKVALKQECGPT